MAAIGEKLQKLEDEGLKLEQLTENEEFITAACMHRILLYERISKKS